jgi:hypothetical protein
VGNNEDAGALVRSANISRRKRDRKRRIAESFQALADSHHPSLRGSGDVFDNNPSWLALINNSLELSPEAASITFQASSLASW